MRQYSFSCLSPSLFLEYTLREDKDACVIGHSLVEKSPIALFFSKTTFLKLFCRNVWQKITDFSDCSSGGVTEKVIFPHCTNSITGTDRIIHGSGNPCATNLGHICVKLNENGENMKALRASKHYITVKKMLKEYRANA